MRSPLAAQHGPTSSPNSHLDSPRITLFWTQPCLVVLSIRCWPKFEMFLSHKLLIGICCPERLKPFELQQPKMARVLCLRKGTPAFCPLNLFSEAQLKSSDQKFKHIYRCFHSLLGCCLESVSLEVFEFHTRGMNPQIARHESTICKACSQSFAIAHSPSKSFG